MTDIMTPLIPEAAGSPEAPPTDIEGLSSKSLSPRQMAMRRFLSHKPAVVATVILVLMILFVLLAPFTARYGINEAVVPPPNRYLTPRSEAWFGTDEIGRDLYSRLIYGTRVSLAIGLAAAFIGVVIGRPSGRGPGSGAGSSTT